MATIVGRAMPDSSPATAAAQDVVVVDLACAATTGARKVGACVAITAAAVEALKRVVVVERVVVVRVVVSGWIGFQQMGA